MADGPRRDRLICAARSIAEGNQTWVLRHGFTHNLSCEWLNACSEQADAQNSCWNRRISAAIDRHPPITPGHPVMPIRFQIAGAHEKR
jgi:hypothetical protein